MFAVNNQQLWPLPALGKQLPVLSGNRVDFRCCVLYSTKSESESEGSRKRKGRTTGVKRRGVRARGARGGERARGRGRARGEQRARGGRRTEKRVKVTDQVQEDARQRKKRELAETMSAVDEVS